ncbi:MAG: cobalamin B12-binding domain-containing protein [Thermodesulfobacteriota bacterium]
MKQFEQALLLMDRPQARAILEKGAMDAGAVDCIESIVVPALESVGSGWETGQVSLSQVYMSGRICEALMDSILPADGAGHGSHPEMAIAVLEDYHLLGKRILATVLRANRYDPVDYGRIETYDLIEQVERDGIEVLLLSTLMLNSALQIKAVRQGLADRGLDVKIIAGGAPFRFDPSLVREVGADATAVQASDVVHVIHGVTGGKT